MAEAVDDPRRGVVQQGLISKSLTAIAKIIQWLLLSLLFSIVIEWVGMVLWWATPFGPLQAALMSLLISVMAFAGGMTMSAIKRDRGVEDYGTLVEGHAGLLDRIDSICFAAPVFFHVTRFFFTDSP